MRSGQKLFDILKDVEPTKELLTFEELDRIRRYVLLLVAVHSIVVVRSIEEDKVLKASNQSITQILMLLVSGLGLGDERYHVMVHEIVDALLTPEMELSSEKQDLLDWLKSN